jgi:hypothetical protein
LWKSYDSQNVADIASLNLMELLGTTCMKMASKSVGAKVVFDLPSGTMHSDIGGEDLKCAEQFVDLFRR